MYMFTLNVELFWSLFVFGIRVHVYTKCTFKCKYVYNGLIKKAIRIS